MDVVKSLLRSRKFLLALVGVVMTLLGTYANLPPAVLASIDALLVAVILGIAHEDAAVKSNPGPDHVAADEQDSLGTAI